MLEKIVKKYIKNLQIFQIFLQNNYEKLLNYVPCITPYLLEYHKSQPYHTDHYTDQNYDDYSIPSFPDYISSEFSTKTKRAPTKITPPRILEASPPNGEIDQLRFFSFFFISVKKSVKNGHKVSTHKVFTKMFVFTQNKNDLFMTGFHLSR